MAGDTGGGQSDFEQHASTRQLPGDPYGIADPVRAVVARVSSELAHQYVNTLLMVPPDPVVQPRVRLFSQFDPRWGSWYVRAPGQRNTFQPGMDAAASNNPDVPQTAMNSNDNWKDNGCFPTCLAMIVRWWAEDHPEFRGKLQFPFPKSAEKLEPVEMCRRLFGRPYAPCVNMAVPDASRPDRAKRGFNDPTREWVMNQDALLAGFRQITREARTYERLPGLSETVIQRLCLLHQRTNISKLDHDGRRAALKAALQYGPAIVNLMHPGHFVVVDAHRGHDISVCDPGNVLVNRGDWATPPDRRSADQLPAGENAGGGYVQVNDQREFKTPSGSFGGPWLMQIASIDRFYSAEGDVHPEWSVPDKTR
jgi:hypothetical protein